MCVDRASLDTNKGVLKKSASLIKINANSIKLLSESVLILNAKEELNCVLVVVNSCQVQAGCNVRQAC